MSNWVCVEGLESMHGGLKAPGNNLNDTHLRLFWFAVSLNRFYGLWEVVDFRRGRLLTSLIRGNKSNGNGQTSGSDSSIKVFNNSTTSFKTLFVRGLMKPKGDILVTRRELGVVHSHSPF
jgi:hypothetical protein